MSESFLNKVPQETKGVYKEQYIHLKSKVFIKNFSFIKELLGINDNK